MLALSLLTGTVVSAQITLDECRLRAQQNYPQIKQYSLVEQTRGYSVSNALRNYLPQISVSGKASYQSDVTEIPFDIPGIDIDGMPKDQYQIKAELVQNIWDGGYTAYQRREAEAAAEEQAREIEVSLYELNDRVNGLYLGALALGVQIDQNRMYMEDLQRTLADVEAYCRNGVANEADADAVKVEMLDASQNETRLQNARDSYLRMLSAFVGENLTPQDLVWPVPPEDVEGEVDRPELRLMDARIGRADARLLGLQAEYMPRFALFAQGGYGNPGLNMLENKFQPYYIIGVSLNWNFGSLYTLKNRRSMVQAEKNMIESSRETFLFNLRLQMAEQSAAVSTMRRQLEKDDEIIRLRTNIRKAAEAKAANGTISVTELLREIMKENMARRDKDMHRVQLLTELYRMKYITNSK